MDMESQVKVEQGQTTAEDECPLVVGALGKLVLASIGAIGLAQDALEHLLQRLVERGEISQKDARRLLQELRGKRPDLSRRGMHKLTETVRDTADLPSKADIQALHNEIAALSAKLDKLGKESEETAKPVPLKPSGK